MDRKWKICSAIVASIVLLFLLLSALVSPIAKGVVNRRGEQLIGRQLHADRVSVNLFNGNVTIRDFHCKEPNGETDFVSFERLYVKIAWPHLIAKQLTLRHIHLDGFHGQVLVANNKLNFSDIIERFASENPSDTTKSNWEFLLRDIQIRNSSIRFRDVIADKQWKVEDITLNLPGFYFDNTQTNAGLEFGLPTGGRVGLVAGYKMQSNRYAFNLRLMDVNADVVLPLVQDYLNVSGLGARINGQVHVDGSLENIQNIQLNGSLTMHGLDVRDMHKEKIAAMKEMRLVMNKCDLSTRTFLLDSLIMTGVTGNYEVHKNWTTLSRLLKTNEEEKTDKKKSKTKEPEKPASKPVVWLAKVVSVSGSNLTYEDHSMKNDWHYAIETLRIGGQNISSNGRNKLKIKAILTSKAQLNVDFVGALDYKHQDTRMNLNLTNVNLRDFNALCKNYTGYPIESGMMQINSTMDIRSGQLTGGIQIAIDEPKIGKKERMSKAPYKNIPVRSTVKSLTYKQDGIEKLLLDAPLQADVTKKKFSFGKLISSALLRETFGKMLSAKKRDKSITKEEWAEMEGLLEED